MGGLTMAALAIELAHQGTSMRAIARVTPGAAADQTLLWYLTRTTAVAAYVSLTVSVLLGMLRSIARTSGERLSWVVDELHGFVATLAGVMVAGHLLSLRLDPYIPFSTTNLFVPGDQPYSPLAVNIGVFGFYTVAVLLVSSWLRRRIPYRLWRGLHYISFLAFALVTAHGWLAGSDVTEPWMRAVYGGAVGSVGFVLLMRMLSRKRVAVQAA